MNKTPLNNQTTQDVLNSLVIGNNLYNSVVVVIVNIGHTTYGDDSPITGDIDVNVTDGDDNTVIAGRCNNTILDGRDVSGSFNTICDNDVKDSEVQQGENIQS